MKIVPATKEMMDAYFGHDTHRTVRAWAGIENGEVLGVGGVCVNRTRLVLFLSMKDATREKLRKYPGPLVRMTRKLQRYAIEKGLPLTATPDNSIPCAEKFLTAMGFENKNGVYVWPCNS